MKRKNEINEINYNKKNKLNISNNENEKIIINEILKDLKRIKIFEINKIKVKKK
jgi:hypothetical protein